MEVKTGTALERIAGEHTHVADLLKKLNDWQHSREILQWYEGHLLGYLDCLLHCEVISSQDWRDAGIEARKLESQWKVKP